MSQQRDDRDPFYSTFAVVAFAVVCLAAFAPAGDQRMAEPMAAPRAAMLTVPADPGTTAFAVAAADPALVGATAGGDR